MPTLEEFLGPLEDEFERRLRAFVEASGGRIGFSSTYRSRERQQQLFCKKARDFGHTGNCDADWMAVNAPEMYARVRTWVAHPGRSNHQRGVAADLTYADDAAVNWAHSNASRFGLVFPLAHEDWHIEPMGLRDGTYEGQPFDIGYDVDEYAYTTDTRNLSPEDIERENMRTVFNTLTGGFSAGPAGRGQAAEPDGYMEGQAIIDAASEEVDPSLPRSASTAGSLDAFMAAIRQKESGGDYDIVNSDSGAYGAYQFMPEYWPEFARQAGVNPNDKSPEAQDRVARFHMQRYYEEYGNWYDVAVAWYGGPGAVGDEDRLHRGQGEYPTIDDYANSVIELMGTV